MIPEPKSIVKEALNIIEAKQTLPIKSNTTPINEINRVFEPILAKNLSTLPNIEVDWVVEGILAKGYMTILGAREKMGKTSLIKGLLKCLATGSPFLGQPINKANVLYISEENAGHWKRRIEDLGLDKCESLWFITQPFNTRLKNKAWEDYLIEEVAPFCEVNEIGVLILDTISPIWPVLDENSSVEVERALLPLKAICKKNVAVFPVHHFSKAGTLRGSTAVGATPDAILDFTRPQGDEESKKRVLKLRTRWEESPDQLLLDYIDNEYVMIGTPQNVARKERSERVTRELAKFPEGATVQEILNSWEEDKKPSRSMLNLYLRDLVFTGEILQLGEKEIKGGRAFIYTSNPNNGNHKQGFPKSADFEANNPLNFDRLTQVNNSFMETEIEPL